MFPRRKGLFSRIVLNNLRADELHGDGEKTFVIEARSTSQWQVKRSDGLGYIQGFSTLGTLKTD